MNDITGLEQQIQERLQKAESRLNQKKRDSEDQMRELKQRQQRFEEDAAKLIEAVIRPRMEKLASFFPNAGLLQPTAGVGHTFACKFEHTDRFPATVKLELGIWHDAQLKNIDLLYKLEILPVFMRFESERHKSFPWDAMPETEAVNWVDEQILGFVDTYLRLEESDRYQNDGLVTAPASG